MWTTPQLGVDPRLGAGADAPHDVEPAGHLRLAEVERLGGLAPATAGGLHRHGPHRGGPRVRGAAGRERVVVAGLVAHDVEADLAGLVAEDGVALGPRAIDDALHGVLARRVLETDQVLVLELGLGRADLDVADLAQRVVHLGGLVDRGDLEGHGVRGHPLGAGDVPALLLVPDLGPDEVRPLGDLAHAEGLEARDGALEVRDDGLEGLLGLGAGLRVHLGEDRERDAVELRVRDAGAGGGGDRGLISLGH